MITDVSPLSGLDQSERAESWLQRHNGRHLPLSGLTNLRELLTLFGNGITDVSAVSGLTNLIKLDFRWNGNITDVSALSGLTNLTQLYAWRQ